MKAWHKITWKSTAICIELRGNLYDFITHSDSIAPIICIKLRRI